MGFLKLEKIQMLKVILLAILIPVTVTFFVCFCICTFLDVLDSERVALLGSRKAVIWKNILDTCKLLERNK